MQAQPEPDWAERVRRLEDERDVTNLILGYGPAADAGRSELAASRWLPEGVYDWDAASPALPGRSAVEALLEGEPHQSFVREGVAHVAGPPLVVVDGDTARALNYSLILRRDGDGYRVWRVSAGRWDLRRTEQGWQVVRRTNRLLDATGAGSSLFAESLPLSGSGLGDQSVVSGGPRRPGP
ncbi:MAG: nuclear transport factor 2 family protein [Nocardioidaceae bacterium]